MNELTYQIIKKGTPSKFFVRAHNNINGCEFGFIAYKGCDYRNTLEEARADLDRIKGIDKRNKEQQKEEIIYSENVSF